MNKQRNREIQELKIIQAHNIKKSIKIQNKQNTGMNKQRNREIQELKIIQQDYIILSIKIQNEQNTGMNKQQLRDMQELKIIQAHYMKKSIKIQNKQNTGMNKQQIMVIGVAKPTQEVFMKMVFVQNNPMKRHLITTQNQLKMDVQLEMFIIDQDIYIIMGMVQTKITLKLKSVLKKHYHQGITVNTY